MLDLPVSAAFGVTPRSCFWRDFLGESAGRTLRQSAMSLTAEYGEDPRSAAAHR
jgi:hypothetical protein